MVVYSFDLWYTLIRSNPDFKLRRDAFLFSFINEEAVFSEFEKIVNRVALAASRQCEITGVHVPCTHIIYKIFQKCEVELNLDEYALITQTIQTLFLLYPPYIYDEHTAEVLRELSARRNHKLDLRSNTGFIYGSTLIVALQRMGIWKYFDEMFFSDEIGYAKPHQKMFEQGRQLSNVEKWIHVGDNANADGGCVNYGAEFFHVNSNDKTLADLLL